MIVVTEQYHYSDQDFLTSVVGVFEGFVDAYNTARIKYDANEQLEFLEVEDGAYDLWYRVITSGESVCVSFSEFELNKLK